MKNAETYSFTGRIEKIDKIIMHFMIVVPPEVLDAIGAEGRIRAKGTMNGAPFALAIQNLKSGERYFSVSAGLRRAAKAKNEGDPVKVVFHLVDENELDVPEELEAVLAQDDEGRAAFDKLTIGYQRSLIHYVTGAKSVDVRIKRAMELIERAKLGVLTGAKKKEE